MNETVLSRKLILGRDKQLLWYDILHNFLCDVGSPFMVMPEAINCVAAGIWIIFPERSHYSFRYLPFYCRVPPPQTHRTCRTRLPLILMHLQRKSSLRLSHSCPNFHDCVAQIAMPVESTLRRVRDHSQVFSMYKSPICFPVSPHWLVECFWVWRATVNRVELPDHL